MYPLKGIVIVKPRRLYVDSVQVMVERVFWSWIQIFQKVPVVVP